MRKPAILAAAFALVAVSFYGCDESSLTEPTKVTAQSPTAPAFSTENPVWESRAWGLGGCREHVIGTLYQFRRGKLTYDATGGIHETYLYFYRGTGIGQSSGTEYVWHQNDPDVLNSGPGYEPPRSRSFVSTIRLIAHGYGLDWSLNFHRHYTINANGETTVDFEWEDMTCR